LFKNPPLIPPTLRRGAKGDFDLFLFYLQEKVYIKTYKVKKEQK